MKLPGNKADDYYNGLDDNIRASALELRKIILAALPTATEAVKWGFPVYDLDGLVCSVRGTQKHVALQFFESGTALDDPDGLLEGSGKKMRHIKIRQPSDIKIKLFKSWLAQAAAMNRQKLQ